MKNKTTVLVALAVVLMAFLFTSCQKKGENKDQLEKIKKAGEITIAMEGTWAPWTYHDQNNELTGYDVEVGKKIAEGLGVKAKFVEVDWDGIFAGLDSKRFDIALNGVNVTDERSKKYDFSEPYAYAKTAIIVNKDSDSIKGLEDLNGKITANSIGSIYAEIAENYGAKVVTIDSFEETLELVKFKRADATLNDTVTFYYYQKVKPDNEFKIAAVSPEANLVAIPVRKNSESKTLLEEINRILLELKNSGELSSISEKYFGADITNE